MEHVHMNLALQKIIKYVIIMEYVYWNNKFVNVNQIGLKKNVIKVNINVINKDVKVRELVILMVLVPVIMD